MDRITEKQLYARIKYLNELTGNPVDSYKMVNSHYHAQIGNYHLDIAYGGYALNQMYNDNGGVTQVIMRCSKRELYNQINRLIDGIAIGKGL